MRRRLRLLIILLLSLTLPLTGMAGIEAPMEPCPMQSMGMSEMAGMDQDCCQDSGTMNEHGKKSCKTGQECKTSSLLQIDVLKASLPPAPTTAPAPYSDPILSQAPAERWRPPYA
ncbi:TPA: hypothetical protein U8181_001245 [Pseudomonas aeruginosa]|nr:hypothetical protein [Pseudomonas aeruginosa]EIU3183897.1 hypothetical protein [Pseudomonas aeruginosa]EIU3229570.1 hypothetical protein [Pseudomonas aeruginosa]EIU3238367.1 hypothetical protein [Pseudomonas aeruginosa]EKU7532113.1 hypothetical protein [Pseudomonas aeruginosa]EKV3039910.1 hypothetical protein [Pseudomonas aeruginosa]